MADISILKLKLIREGTIHYEPVLNTISAGKVFARFLKDEPQEVFSMIALDQKNVVMGYFEVHRGAVDRSIVSIKEVAKRALLVNASKVIVAHNHPSGNTKPSREDVIVTNALETGLGLLEIQLLDHIIIGSDGALSIKEMMSNDTMEEGAY